MKLINRNQSMRYHYIFASIIVFCCFFLLYSVQIRVPYIITSTIPYSSQVNHTAIILARRPSLKVLKHLNALVKAGVNAYVMCDEQPWKYTNITNRILYVNDESLAEYGLTRNLVWDRVFIWLYNQSSIDNVWLMEDDVTWSNIQYIVNLFDRYADNKADLLSRNIIYKNNQTRDWIWWPKTSIDLFPENKWSGSLNMLCRVSRRLINAHQYYTRQLFNERKKNSTNKFDNNYYFQEFFTPTVANMFNLTMVIYNHSNMDVHVFSLSEDDIRKSLANGKQIFHPVKHDSQLLIDATE